MYDGLFPKCALGIVVEWMFWGRRVVGGVVDFGCRLTENLFILY
jgi:hypothetical protein